MDDKVKSFIDQESGIPHKKALRSFAFTVVILGIPTALLGKGSNITSIIIIPIMLFFVGWTIYISFKVEKKRKLFYLYLGLDSVFQSLIFLLASYKLLSTILYISPMTILIVMLSYCMFIFISLLVIMKLIKSGFYLKHKNGKVAVSLIFPFAVLGLLIGKATAPYISQNTAITIISYFFVFTAVVFSIGSISVLKFILIRKLEREESLTISNKHQRSN
ncbi:MAG: hypothetical protein WC677_01900 [Clostridia bacterium]